MKISRSFSRKLNLGNYETCDVFCAAEIETDGKDFERFSDLLFKQCKSEVMRDIENLRAEKNKAVNSKVRKLEKSEILGEQRSDDDSPMD